MPGSILIGANNAVYIVDSRGDPINVDCFGNLKVAAPYTLADHTFKYEIDPTTFGTLTATGGAVTHVANQSAAQLAVTGASGSRAVLRSHEFYRYQSGKGLTIRWSAIHTDAGQANQTRRWGFFDDGDGLFFALSGTTLQVVRRTSTSGAPVDNATPQAAWNVDKMDGTGPSGITLDVTRGNIYEVQLQWLGVGVSRFFVDGQLVHEEQHANLLTVPYMKTAVLPLECEVVNTGASVASSMRLVCATVIVDGGMEAPDQVFGAFNATDVSVPTTEIPLLSIRPKTTLNGVTNRIQILPTRAFLSAEGGRAGFRILRNPTLTGAAFASVDASSGVEFDTAATAFSGGSTLYRGFLPDPNSARELVTTFFRQNGPKLLLDAFGVVQPIITLTGICEVAGTTDMRASVAWTEIR